METKKLSKFQRISEATQSQRISSISDTIREKLGLLEKLLNNNNIKFISFFNQEPKNEEVNQDKITTEKSTNISGITSLQSAQGNSTLSVTKDITNYFSHDTKERKIYNTINHNILKFLNMKKTLILIIDTFTNNEEAKSYINSIISKINDTKCPIIILTSKFNFKLN